MKKALCILLAVTFITCVFCYKPPGENGIRYRFSFEQWIGNVAAFGEISTMQDLIDVWTLSYYLEEYDDYAGGRAIQYRKVYYEDPDVTGDIPQFFNSIKGFFARLFRSIRLICEMFADIFTLADKLLPWNAVVEVT